MSGRVDRLTLEPVEYMPEELQPGLLYFSEQFELAIHLCACGCGMKTVTPIGDDEWTLDNLTMRPSILNPCKAHYYVTAGQIEWL